jgi:ubiquinone/menaquinone biosynthesis C-methylase UbiE
MEDQTERQSVEISEKEFARLSFKGGRNYSEYKKFLRFNESDIEGKKILDLGSGPESTFAEEVEEKMPNTKVTIFGFDADRVDRDDPSNEIEDNYPDSVKGLFTKLPFEDASFDVVVSSAAMPLYLTKEEQVREAFREVVRVLKSGGRAFIAPINYTKVIDPDEKEVWYRYKKHSFEESKELLSKILKEMSAQIDFDFIPAETRLKMGFEGAEEKIVSPAVLVINKKLNSTLFDKLFNKS